MYVHMHILIDCMDTTCNISNVFRSRHK